MSSARSVPLTTPVARGFSNPSSLGSNVLVAAVSGMSIRVLSAVIVATGATSVKFLSDATDISGTYPLAANGGIVMDFNEHGWHQTKVGEGLNVNLSTGVAVGISFQYMVI